jgi:glycosyltransferase involved in cell wall biosynthesis
MAQQDDAPRIRLRIIGSNVWGGFVVDAYGTSLQQRVAALEALGVEVEQLGHVDRGPRVAELLRGSDVHVVPSRWDEPFGLTTLEGMASGCAVVVTATGGSPEVVGDAGVLVARDDPDALAAKLGWLARDARARNELATAARARSELFSWDCTVDSLLGAFGAAGVGA